MKFKDIVKVGAGFLAGGLYVCWVEADACKRGSWYIQHRNKDGDIGEIGKPIFDPNTANEGLPSNRGLWPFKFFKRYSA